MYRKIITDPKALLNTYWFEYQSLVKNINMYDRDVLSKKDENGREVINIAMPQ